uniref:Fucosyltransferase n=1 Tax=Guillardia theta TaxID=55529 RepID=A0A7S4PHS2_GUITH|mmetsp:Transcript_51172/g.159871  ORF Transcript_51172/g.159871 Transcript_51172/m.159871 type:complete len:456 (+) Transcript_51172:191-1558(+)
MLKVEAAGEARLRSLKKSSEKDRNLKENETSSQITSPWDDSDKRLKKYYKNESRLLSVAFISSIAFIVAALLYSYWSALRSVRMSTVDNASPLCNLGSICMMNYAIRSILYDFQNTRTISLNPYGTHTMIEPGYNKLDSCSVPVLMYYSPSLLNCHLGLPLEHEAVEECKISCQITSNKSDADILVGIDRNDPVLSSKAWWQKVAIINLHPASINIPTLASADMLISFHRYSDVKLNFIGSSLTGELCSNISDDCIDHHLLSASFFDFANSPGKAVLRMDDKCDRLDALVHRLVESLRRHLPVDTIGRCFAGEGSDREIRRYEKDTADSHYKFNLVVEDEVVEDFLTDRFYKGMLDAARGSLMVYLGAPNADSYAVAPGGYLNILKFSDLDSIGEFLGKLDRNASLYRSFFSWRSNPQQVLSRIATLRKFDHLRKDSSSWQCRTCERYFHRYCDS